MSSASAHSRNRRKRNFANKIHKDLFIFLAFASIIPAIIVTVCMYYLIFSIVAQEVGMPEGIAYYIIPAAKKVSLILICVAPLSIGAILFFAYEMTHKMLGLYDRIVKDLEDVVHGRREHHIRIRKNDDFKPLVDNINKLIDLTKKKSDSSP